MTMNLCRHRELVPLSQRCPLRVMFVITNMPVGGAETLLVELIRRLDRNRFSPELCCLKHFGPLGEVLAKEVPAFAGLLNHKYDFAVFNRLRRLLADRQTDAVITVGTGGDKMFWGRLAARAVGVPVVCSALHSTGLPDHVELPNRLLAPITDAFIAVAPSHGEYLVRHEGCPRRKVRVIPNGVDTERFHPRWPNRSVQAELGLEPDMPTAGIVAALRPEKNHELFLRAAAIVHAARPRARFLVIGDGPRRAALEQLASEWKLDETVCFLGTRSDIPEVLSVLNVLLLTSHMEANPVSILEALAAEKPVVATRVGSVPETVRDGENGYLVPPDDAVTLAARTIELLDNRERAEALGRAGRETVLRHWSIDRMVAGYEQLITEIHEQKLARCHCRLGRV